MCYTGIIRLTNEDRKQNSLPLCQRIETHCKRVLSASDGRGQGEMTQKPLLHPKWES